MIYFTQTLDISKERKVKTYLYFCIHPHDILPSLSYSSSITKKYAVVITNIIMFAGFIYIIFGYMKTTWAFVPGHLYLLLFLKFIHIPL